MKSWLVKLQTFSRRSCKDVLRSLQTLVHQSTTPSLLLLALWTHTIDTKSSSAEISQRITS